jgi:hypothetical protein
MCLRRAFGTAVLFLTVTNVPQALAADPADSADTARPRIPYHGEFLLGGRVLPSEWRPYDSQVVFGLSGGVMGRRKPIGLDGGFAFCISGSGGSYGPNRYSSLLELFAGVGKSWIATPRGRFAYVGAGPSFVYGEFRAPHSGDPGSDTSLGFYARAGSGFVRIAKTRLGLEARYSYGARLNLQSVRRRADGVSLAVIMGAGH